MTQQHLAIFFGATLLSACTSTSRSAAQAGLPDTGQPALHAVSNARLRELINQMNSLMCFITESEIERERRIYALKIADAAGKLGSTVYAILSRLPALNLKPDEQMTFRALVDKLREQADALNAKAKLNHIDTLVPMLDQVTATCSSCYTFTARRWFTSIGETRLGDRRWPMVLRRRISRPS